MAVIVRFVNKEKSHFAMSEWLLATLFLYIHAVAHIIKKLPFCHVTDSQIVQVILCFPEEAFLVHRADENILGDVASFYNKEC